MATLSEGCEIHHRAPTCCSSEILISENLVDRYSNPNTVYTYTTIITTSWIL
ncbi:unnamed protein product, partial [Nesidiocoris tenuis]